MTPNVLMFDPSASEPAVRELGLEPLGLTVPLLDVERVKVYNSDAALRLRFPGSSPPPQQPSQAAQPQQPQQHRTDEAATITSEKKGAETGAASGEQPASGTQELPSATAAATPPATEGATTSSEQAVPTETKRAPEAASEAKADVSPPAVVVTEQPQSLASAEAVQPAATAPAVVSLDVRAADAKAEAEGTAVEAIKLPSPSAIASGSGSDGTAAPSKTDAKHAPLATEPSSVQPARPRTPQPVQVQLVNAVSMKERADLFQPIESVLPSDVLVLPVIYGNSYYSSDDLRVYGAMLIYRKFRHKNIYL